MGSTIVYEFVVIINNCEPVYHFIGGIFPLIQDLFWSVVTWNLFYSRLRRLSRSIVNVYSKGSIAYNNSPTPLSTRKYTNTDTNTGVAVAVTKSKRQSDVEEYDSSGNENTSKINTGVRSHPSPTVSAVSVRRSRHNMNAANSQSFIMLKFSIKLAILTLVTSISTIVGIIGMLIKKVIVVYVIHV